MPKDPSLTEMNRHPPQRIDLNVAVGLRIPTDQKGYDIWMDRCAISYELDQSAISAFNRHR